MLDRFYFRASYHVGYPEQTLRKAKRTGYCNACKLMLMEGDTVCPRCGTGTTP